MSGTDSWTMQVHERGYTLLSIYRKGYSSVPQQRNGKNCLHKDMCCCLSLAKDRSRLFNALRYHARLAARLWEQVYSAVERTPVWPWQVSPVSPVGDRDILERRLVSFEMSEPDTDQDLRQLVTSLSDQVKALSSAFGDREREADANNLPVPDTGLGEDEVTTINEEAFNRSLTSGYQNAVRGERLLQDAGYSDGTNQQPKLIEITREARKAAMRMSATGVTGDYDDDEDDIVEDRGKGAQAELPPGVPDWPPRPFLARQKVFTKPWQVWLLKQGESVRNEADPCIAEGDCLSNVVL